jgi:hypothetical protein
MLPGISWAGHLGGGIAGAVVSVPLIWSLYGQGGQRLLGWAGVVAVPVIALVILYQAIAPARPIDDAELNKARREYAPILARILGIGITRYEAHAKPFLDLQQGQLPDAELVQKAQAAFAQALANLQAERDALDKLGRYQSAALNHHIELAQQYASKLESFYRQMSEQLTADENWQAHQEALKELWARTDAFRDRQLRKGVYEQLIQ